MGGTIALTHTFSLLFLAWSRHWFERCPLLPAWKAKVHRGRFYVPGLAPARPLIFNGPVLHSGVHRERPAFEAPWKGGPLQLLCAKWNWCNTVCGINTEPWVLCDFNISFGQSSWNVAIFHPPYWLTVYWRRPNYWLPLCSCIIIAWPMVVWAITCQCKSLIPCISWNVSLGQKSG